MTFAFIRSRTRLMWRDRPRRGAGDLRPLLAGATEPAPLGEQLCHEALTLGDSFHLERDRLDRLLEPVAVGVAPEDAALGHAAIEVRARDPAPYLDLLVGLDQRRRESNDSRD